MKNKYSLHFIIIAFAVLAIGIGTILNVWAETSKTPSGVYIALREQKLTPFSILFIDGKGLNQTAATAVVFTMEDGDSLTVPAITVTPTGIEIMVPPATYSETDKEFSQQSGTLKVIQIKSQGTKLNIMSSNEIKGVTILSPKYADQYGESTLPKGALTRSFLAASLQSLQTAKDKLPADNTSLKKSLTLTQIATEQLIVGVKKQISEKGSVSVKVAETTITLNDDQLEKLDQIYAGILGAIEQQGLLSADQTFLNAFLPEANAAGISECERQMQGEDPALAKLLKEPCQFETSVAMQAQKAGEVLPAAAKIAYSVPLILSGMSLDYLVAQAAVSKAAQIALSSSFSILTDALVEGKVAVSGALTSVATAITDDKLGLPLTGLLTPSAQLCRDVSKAMTLSETKTPKTSQIILGALNAVSTSVRYITSNGTKTTVNTVTLPAARQSATVSKIPTSSVAKKSTPVLKPAASKTPVQTTPAPQPEPESESVSSSASEHAYSVAINLTATEHTQCDGDCIGYISDSTATTTITLNNLIIASGTVGSGSTTVSAPFTYSCSSTASGGKSGSVSASLNGYAFSIFLESSGLLLRYQGEPRYTYFANTCEGTAQDPTNLIKKALEKAFGSRGELYNRIYSNNGETASFSGRDNDAAISNDVSYFEWSGTITLTRLR